MGTGLTQQSVVHRPTTAQGGAGRGARWAWGVNAAVAWAGAVLTVVLSTADAYAHTKVYPGLYGYHAAGWAGALPRLVDSLSYFTMWSNLAVAVSATLLAVRPGADGPWYRALRTASLMMITVTAVVYALFLAPYVPLSGWSLVTNPAQHVVTPALTLLVWLVQGPRGWLSAQVLRRSLLLPVAWVVWMLAHGALTGTYPYGFVDVGALGYPAALLAVGVVLAFGVGVGALLTVLDRRLTRRGRPVLPGGRRGPRLR